MGEIGNIRRNFMSKSIDKTNCLIPLESGANVCSLGLERPGCRRGGRGGSKGSRKHEHKCWYLMSMLVGWWTQDAICMADLGDF